MWEVWRKALMVFSFLFFYQSPEPPNTLPDLLLLASFLIYAGVLVWLPGKSRRLALFGFAIVMLSAVAQVGYWFWSDRRFRATAP